MKMTVLKTAQTMAEIELMGIYIKDSDDTSLNNFYDSFYSLLEMPIHRRENITATLNRVDLDHDQYYHVIAVLLEDGRQFSVDDRHTLSNIFGDLDASTKETEQEAKKWRALVGLAGKEKIKLFLNDRERGYWGSVESAEDFQKFHQYIEHEVADTEFGEYGKRLDTAFKEAMANGTVPPLRKIRLGKRES